MSEISVFWAHIFSTSLEDTNTCIHKSCRNTSLSSKFGWQAFFPGAEANSHRLSCAAKQNSKRSTCLKHYFARKIGACAVMMLDSARMLTTFTYPAWPRCQTHRRWISSFNVDYCRSIQLEMPWSGRSSQTSAAWWLAKRAVEKQRRYLRYGE